jgi:hypothetical protein
MLAHGFKVEFLVDLMARDRADRAHGRRRASGRSHPLSHHGNRFAGTLASSMALILKRASPRALP